MTTTDLNTNNNQPPQGGQTPPQQGDSTTQQQQQGQGQTPPTSQQTPPTSQSNQQQQQHSQLTDHWTDDDREYIKRLRKEAKDANDKVEAIAREKAQAEQDRLKQQGEYKQLAEQHEAKVKELEPKAAELAEIATMINQQIEVETKDWPASVKALAPSSDASIAQRLAWRTKGQVIIAEMTNTARGQAPGNGQNPPSVGGNQQSQAGVDDLRQRLQAQRGNPF